jgi:hypothetical protein
MFHQGNKILGFVKESVLAQFCFQMQALDIKKNNMGRF